MFFLNLLRKEKGSIAVLMAISMTVLAGFTAFALDFGQVYYERYQLTNIVDSAALAGAQEMPENYSEAEDKAKEYAEINGGNFKEINVTIDESSNTIRVDALRSVSYKFARILGFEGTSVSAVAVAKVGTVGETSGIMPFGIQEQQLNFGQLYDLKVDAPPEYGAGNFGALALGGPGANIYRNNIKYTYDDEPVGVTDVLDTETGNMDDPTGDGISYRLNEETCETPCTPDSFERDCSRLVTVPVYVPLGDKNNIKEVEVIGFAAFLLEEVTSDSSIKGYFVETIVPGGIDNTTGDYGLKSVKLIE